MKKNNRPEPTQEELDVIEQTIEFGLFDNYEKKILDQKILLNISEMINSKLNLHEMNEALLFTMLGTIHTSKMAIFLMKSITDNTFVMVDAMGIESSELQLEISEESQLIQELSKKLTPLTIEDLCKNAKCKKELTPLAPIEPQLLVPMNYKNQLSGFMVFGPKMEGKEFANNELTFLSSVANFAAIAVENIRLFEMATKDRMTNLFVHHYFQNRLEEETARAIRYKSPLSLIMLDIDHFKPVNDTYGHQAGDIVIQEIAEIIKNSLRKLDMPARYGGEEFAIILPESNKKNALMVAERIRKRIESSPFKISEDKKINITISGGVCELADILSPEETKKGPPKKGRDTLIKNRLIKCSDKALYSSKHNGRNQITVYKDEQ